MSTMGAETPEEWDSILGRKKTLTTDQILAIAHVRWHSLGKPRDECRRCQRLRKKLTRKEQP